MTSKPYTIICQAAKLGDMPYLLRDFELARQLDAQGTPSGRIYGNSSGVLVALVHSLVLAARARPGLVALQALNALGINKSPRALARAVANWGPLRERLARFIEQWTGCKNDAELREAGQSAMHAHHDLPDLKGNWQRAWGATR